MRYAIGILTLLIVAIQPLKARGTDEPNDTTTTDTATNPYRFRYTQLIIPAVMIGAGFVGLESDWIKRTNNETKDELQEHSHPLLVFDNYIQYVPLAATYGLRLCGIKGTHDYLDLTIIAGTAYLLTGISVYSVKSFSHVERPDNSTSNSFPSGHTATAFAGAEILRREYWNVSPWIGVAGYTVAVGTGFLRMYNNRHWLTDVVAGAGFGILCAQAAYWLYPLLSKTLFPNRHSTQTGYHTTALMTPYITPRDKGLTLSLTF